MNKKKRLSKETFFKNIIDSYHYTQSSLNKNPNTLFRSSGPTKRNVQAKTFDGYLDVNPVDIGQTISPKHTYITACAYAKLQILSEGYHPF